MDNIQKYKDCPMRTKLGNCDPIGGFCTSVNESICEAFQKLYRPERKKGKWILEYYTWFCSECHTNPTKGMGYVQGYDELFDFCPRCGADMRGETDV